MDTFHIHGPCRLQGSVRISGAKNAALPALAASLLVDDTLLLRKVPPVRDIATMRRLLANLGVVSQDTEDGVELSPSHELGREGLHQDEAHYDLVKTMRASVLVLGPLLARRGHARVSLPGGCAIGVRPIEQHLAGLRALGAQVELSGGYVDTEAKRLAGARFRFSKATVGGTENLLMAASLAKGETVLENCAREPEVVDLAHLLCRMGAQIEGAGEATIHIEGTEDLHSADHSVISDRIEAGTYLIAAALTGGDVRVENVQPGHLEALLEKLEETGSMVDVGSDWVRLQRNGELRARDVVTAPYPGFPTDLQAQYLALMTQAEGPATVCESVFENRFQHVPELARMGARIEIDGNYARVPGPTALSGAHVMATDLRASACLVLAGLVAEGRTVVHRIYHLDRGYEEMELKLQKLGARVERIST